LFSHFFAILSSILIGLFTLNTIFMVYLLGFSILLAEFQFKKYFSPPPHTHTSQRVLDKPKMSFFEF
jgi:hypothetical protein